MNESLAKLAFLKLQKGEEINLLTLPFLDSSEYKDDSIFSNSFFGQSIKELDAKNGILVQQFNKYLSTFSSAL